ncbi:hypothetical protein D3C87_184180 [compost metagenome]
MSFKKIQNVVLIIGGVFCSANLAAQQLDSTFVDINYVRRQSAWINSKNAAGLKHFNLSKLSNAEVFFDKSNGDFKNFHQSNDSYEYGLNTNSIYRLNDKIVFEGAISYQNFKGENMGGSTFIDPYKNPFDIVELDDNNKGIKRKETYGLHGAISVQMASKFSIGGRINYQAANFAKAKDLRHINKLLDMDLSAGGIYKINDLIEVGATYNYERRIESTFFKAYGNFQRGFSSLISFGSFFGTLETFGESGYTQENATRPLTNFSHGFSLQLNLQLNNNTHFFNEFTYSKPKGYFGEKGTVSYVFTEHAAESYNYYGVFVISKGKNEYQISLSANYGNLSNQENVYRRETTPGGVSRIVYYGKRDVLEKQDLDVDLAYVLFKDIQNYNPKWKIELNANYFRRQQTTTVYPFYRDQTINSYNANVHLKRNIVKAKQMYSFALCLGYGSGSGIAKYDGLYVPPSSSQAAPASMDLYLYQEFEYFTKPRVMADISLQYTKKLKQNIAPYAKLSYNYTKAFDTQFLGSNFGIAGASVGCNF